MSKGEDMRQNAEDCSELANQAADAPAKARYRRIAASWTNLAQTQDWLDGKTPPDQGKRKKGLV